MHTAAKLARAGDRLVSMVAAALIVIMLLFGGYSLWDTAMVFKGAFLDSDLLAFKPGTTGDPDSNPTLEELQAINPDVLGWLTIDDTHIDYPVSSARLTWSISTMMSMVTLPCLALSLWPAEQP